MSNTRTCPICGAVELVADCRSITATVKGQKITVPDIHGDFCPACGEGILDRENGDRYGAALAKELASLSYKGGKAK